jgi:Tfp pilus assembly protein PilF
MADMGLEFPTFPKTPRWRGRQRRRLAAVVFLGLVLAVVWGAWYRGSRTIPSLHTSDISFRNLDPTTKYVGDVACASCHPDQATTYRKHPMGRSFASIAKRAALERFGPEAHDPLDISGFVFHADQQEGRMVHGMSRKGSKGQILGASTADIQFAIGSGTRGRSYVINRDGFLFQSPLSWYSAKQAWGLSPHRHAAGELLYRPIQAQCMFCHCNAAKPVPDTVNHYREPVQGEAIGCERCHGPGELHVRQRAQGAAKDDADDTIVNPRRLEPLAREAVCQQCHLLGVARIIRHGREPFDFRPSMQLRAVWTVFVQAPTATEPYRLVSQVEQLSASRCFRASAGKLGCTSCHDPHALPPAETKGDYYRERCLHCHGENSCALTLTARRARTPGDHCTDCHMAAIQSTDIGHMAFTDHRILRRPDPGNLPPSDASAGSGQDVRLVPFGIEPETAGDRETARARGLALMDLAGLKRQEQARVALARKALPLLDAAVARTPSDAAAWQAKGYALWLLGQPREGLSALQTALTLAPGREETLMYAAGLAAQLKQADAAVAYWRRALEVNPWSVRYHFELARLLGGLGHWLGALKECRTALQLDPPNLEAQMLSVACHIRLGNRNQAQQAFDELLEWAPPDPEKLRRWFAEQINARAPGPP